MLRNWSIRRRSNRASTPPCRPHPSGPPCGLTGVIITMLISRSPASSCIPASAVATSSPSVTSSSKDTKFRTGGRPRSGPTDPGLPQRPRPPSRWVGLAHTGKAPPCHGARRFRPSAGLRRNRKVRSNPVISEARPGSSFWETATHGYGAPHGCMVGR
jgi:hypothetical protein